MTGINKQNGCVCRRLWSEVQIQTKKAAWVVADTEALGYVAKAVKDIISIALPILKNTFPGAQALSGLSDLSNELGDFAKFLGSLKAFQRGKDWTSPSARRQMFTDGWESVAARVALTAGQVIDTVNYLESLSLFSLGAVSSFSVGNVPVLSFVKDACYLAACSLGIVTDSKKICGANRNLERWRVLSEKTDEELQDYYTDKIDQVAAGAGVDNNRDKWIKRKENVEHLRDYKQVKYSHQKKKCWVSIVANITKIAIITLGITTLALGVQGLFAVGITMTAVSLIVNAIGVGKKIFNEFHDPVPAYKNLVNAAVRV